MTYLGKRLQKDWEEVEINWTYVVILLSYKMLYAKFVFILDSILYICPKLDLYFCSSL